MDEQEIISYLKGNSKKGVIFAFMPDEVQRWCKKHFSEHIFSVYVDDKWSKKIGNLCLNDSVYALSENYEPESEFEPTWQEFEIDKEGGFEFEGTYYFWHQWSTFLSLAKDKFNAFGGWLFDDIWRLTPRVVDDEGVMQEIYHHPKTIFPAIPGKVRFWRYKA